MLTEERYSRDNPNIVLIHALKQAGVDIRVCGQGTARQKDRSEAGQSRRPDRSKATTTLVNLQLRGYVRVG